jgi:hypothetical protein
MIIEPVIRYYPKTDTIAIETRMRSVARMPARTW